MATMRKIVVNRFLTLHSIMLAPGSPDEDPTGSLEHGGRAVGYWDDLIVKVRDGSVGRPFDPLLGRQTYELYAVYLPHATDREGVTPLNSTTKYAVNFTSAVRSEYNSYTVVETGNP